MHLRNTFLCVFVVGGLKNRTTYSCAIDGTTVKLIIIGIYYQINLLHSRGKLLQPARSTATFDDAMIDESRDLQRREPTTTAGPKVYHNCNNRIHGDTTQQQPREQLIKWADISPDHTGALCKIIYGPRFLASAVSFFFISEEKEIEQEMQLDDTGRALQINTTGQRGNLSYTQYSPRSQAVLSSNVNGLFYAGYMTRFGHVCTYLSLAPIDIRLCWRCHGSCYSGFCLPMPLPLSFSRWSLWRLKSSFGR